MHTRRSLLLGGAITALLTASIALPARAEIAPEAASELVAAALASEGVSLSDSALERSLTEAISDAAEAGVLDPAIVEAVSPEPSESPAPSESPTPSASPNEGLEGLLEENEQEQLDRWSDLSDEIQVAFGAIRVDVVACREASASSSSCVKGLGLRFQIALTEVKLAALQAEIDAVASLPAEEQAAALAELEARQAKVLDKLADKQAKFAARTEAATDTAKADELLGRFGAKNKAEPAPVDPNQPVASDGSVLAPSAPNGAGNSGSAPGSSGSAPSEKANNGNGPAEKPGKGNTGKNAGKGNGANG